MLQYDQATETVPIITPAEIEIISDDHLKTLDKELAPYPFEGLERWRCLCGHVDQEMVHEVFGPSGRVDGMNPAEGEVDEKGSKSKPLEGERTMRFPVFNLKRSWRDGAIGEEITRYAKDKSWLMGDVLISHGSGKSSFFPCMCHLVDRAYTQIREHYSVTSN